MTSTVTHRQKHKHVCLRTHWRQAGRPVGAEATAALYSPRNHLKADQAAGAMILASYTDASSRHSQRMLLPMLLADLTSMLLGAPNLSARARSSCFKSAMMKCGECRRDCVDLHRLGSLRSSLTPCTLGSHSKCASRKSQRQSCRESNQRERTALPQGKRTALAQQNAGGTVLMPQQ